MGIQSALPSADLRYSGSASWTLPYRLNGRFLTQPTTGVQRYALEVVRSLDLELCQRGGRATMLAPRSAAKVDYRAIDVKRWGRTAGPVWEQAELGFARRQPILSLCNVGPLLATDQILCIHDVNVLRCPESYSPGFRRFYRALLPRLVRRAARLVTVSRASRRDLARVFSLRESDIEVFPNGHEHALEWRAERSALNDPGATWRPFVLMIGSRAIHKNLPLVLGLAGALDALGLDIVVAGGDAAIFAPSAREGAGNVRFLGRVSEDDLGWLYRNALCLAFPSRFEGFGLPMLEAMALGCPVIAAPIPSSREVCGSAAAYAEADDASAWLKLFSSLARNPGLRAEMVERGRLRAPAYSWRATAIGYLEIAARGRA